MADTITPERVQELCDVSRMIRPDLTVCAEQFYGPMIEPLTIGELDALLLVYQRQQETCEWTLVPDAVYVTECGMNAMLSDAATNYHGQRRPCWCGRKVEVTR